MFGIMLGYAADLAVNMSGLKLKAPKLANLIAVVDCLLPGQLRQLGSRVTYVTERRPIRTTAEDCAIRRGE